jgi:hypothetical protein
LQVAPPKPAEWISVGTNVLIREAGPEHEEYKPG